MDFVIWLGRGSEETFESHVRPNGFIFLSNEKICRGIQLFTLLSLFSLFISSFIHASSPLHQGPSFPSLELSLLTSDAFKTCNSSLLSRSAVATNAMTVIECLRIMQLLLIIEICRATNVVMEFALSVHGQICLLVERNFGGGIVSIFRHHYIKYGLSCLN